MVIGRERGKNTIVCVAMPESILKINLSADKCEFMPIAQRILVPAEIIRCALDCSTPCNEFFCKYKEDCRKLRERQPSKDDVIMLV